MSLLSKVRGEFTLARANTAILERPDRFPRALIATIPYGTGMLGGIAAAAARYPDASALIVDGHPMTYRELWRSSNSLALGLSESGVGTGTKIGVLCRNSALFVQAVLAGAKVGADLIFLNTGMGPGQLSDVVASEKLGAVIHDDEFGPALARAGAALLVSGSRAAALIGEKSADSLPKPTRVSQLVILTSGTTGAPKGAARSSGGASIDGVAAVLGRMPIRLRDTIVVSAPFFHAWGLANLLIGLGLSATVVTSPQFDPEQTITSVAREKAGVLIAVPATLQRICSLEPQLLARIDTSSLKVLAVSGSVLPARLAIEAMDRFGPILYNVYGSTEVATATIAGPKDLRRSPSTSGRPALGVTVLVADERGRPVDTGITGRVFVGNAAHFDGYTGGGDKEKLHGLVSSGDLGHFDVHGQLFIDGREDDMIVSGGENVYPGEVEEVLNAHEDILEAVVLGVDDPRFGQALKAVIVMRPGRTIEPDTLKFYVGSRLARYKVPRTFEFVDELPRNATGKVLRRKLA